MRCELQKKKKHTKLTNATTIDIAIDTAIDNNEKYHKKTIKKTGGQAADS